MNVPLRVRDHMVTDLVTVGPDTEVMAVVETLLERDISGVLVLDSDGALLGILTERDCIAVATQSGYFDVYGGPVRDYMSTELETVSPDDSLMDVAIRLSKTRYRRFPVVEDGRLVGLIGRRDVLRVLASGSWFSPA